VVLVAQRRPSTSRRRPRPRTAPDASPPDLLKALENARRECATLEKRLNRLSSLVDDALSAARPGDERAEAAPAPPASPAEAPTTERADAYGSEGARLVAVQLALAGHSREFAERRLAGETEEGSLAGILDEVFGASPVG
jgi:hypothetical protein